MIAEFVFVRRWSKYMSENEYIVVWWYGEWQ